MRMHIRTTFISSLILVTLTTLSVYASAADKSKVKQELEINSLVIIPGVTDNEILLGSVLPLQGQAENLGQQIRIGLDKALSDQIINGRRIRIVYANDLYEPLLTRLRVERLLKQGIFAMVGNFGTPTAAIALPLLKQAGIPAIGFFTGAGLLRTGEGLILNFRASYAQEITAVIEVALKAGIKPEQVCAYVQNDDFGKSGLLGLQAAMIKAKAPDLILYELKELLTNSSKDTLIKFTSENKTPINEKGPVGVYVRNSIEVMPGYEALKKWQQRTGYKCQLVVAVGIYDNLAHFVHTARSLGESWIISAVSFAGADNLFHTLQKLEDMNKHSINGDLHNILMTQVVPPIESPLPIVQEARNFLGKDFSFISLESYIVGRMVLELLTKTPNPLTQSHFLSQAKQTTFNLGGLTIDFTRNGYQGSDFVTITRLIASGFIPLESNDWQTMLAWQPLKASPINVNAAIDSDASKNDIKSSSLVTKTANKKVVVTEATVSEKQQLKKRGQATATIKTVTKKSSKSKTAAKSNNETPTSEKNSSNKSVTTTQLKKKRTNNP